MRGEDFSPVECVGGMTSLTERISLIVRRPAPNCMNLIQTSTIVVSAATCVA